MLWILHNGTNTFEFEANADGDWFFSLPYFIKSHDVGMN
jgi:hypothetical protein